MFKANINSQSFEVISDDESLRINGDVFNWDIVKIADGYFHILLNNKSYKAEVLTADTATKTFSFKINGKIYSVTLKDKFDILLEKLGMNSGTAGKVNNVKAPMPGLIIDLRVKDGDNVKAGDPLLILEAMKMENIIKASGDGLVKTVKVKKGDSVEKNQVMIEF